MHQAAGIHLAQCKVKGHLKVVHEAIEMCGED